MASSIRPSLLMGLLLLMIGFGVSANQAGDGVHLTAEPERTIHRNQYGDVILDSDNRRINYSKQQLEGREAQTRASDGMAQSLASQASTSSSAEASWGYAAFGSGIGLSNINIVSNGPFAEIYLGGSFSTFGGNAYWYALRYDATTQGYEQVYVSPFFTSGIRRIKVADVIGDPAKEIIVALSNGQVILYDQASKAVLQTLNTAATELRGLEVADVDGDGQNELVLGKENHLYVYSGAGMLEWDLTGVGGYDLVVAQMDDDAALEIATTDGRVVDCATRSVQWTWQYGFGVRLAAADIDADGRKELIVAEGWQFVWAYDVERQLPKWSIETSQDIGAIQVFDIDGDSVQELLIGDGQWGSVRVFDTVTRQQEWFIQNPEHGVTNIAVGDVNNDGNVELLWGAGASSTGPDYLYVADWQTRQIEWQNIHLDGPFIGPEVGDLDGDGRDELVVISTSSGSGYSSGRIVVFDSITRRLRAISGPTMAGLGWTGIHDLELRDVDLDGKLEILVAASFTYDGVIEIYSFSPSNVFTLDWTNSTRPDFASFTSVEAADIDGDGDMDIIGGADGYIYVYGYNTTNEEWRSLFMRGTPTALAIADVNHDGTKEIIGMVQSGDVYIFDGPSKELQAILTGPFSAMRVQNVDGALSIVLGNGNGDLKMYRYSSGSYGETYSQRLINGPINGFTIDSQDDIWIASVSDQFSSSGTLTEVTLAGSVLATYSGYGQPFGLRTAFVPATLTFYTTSSYSVVGFPTCAAAVSSASQSFSAAGGLGNIEVTAGAICDWGAVSAADWITVTSGSSGAGNGMVEYSVASNTGPSARIGTLFIAGQTISILQGAAFADVPPGHAFHTEIGKLSARGVTAGCGGGNFCPDQPVTREQMAAFIIRALGEFNPPLPSQQRFGDVPPANPFYGFIDQMAVRQITLGCGGGNYCPAQTVNREQMAAFIIRGLGEFDPPEPAMQRFLDVPPENPFYRFIDRMAVLGITQGCGGGNYCPTQSVTRAQMAAFLVRAFNL